MTFKNTEYIHREGNQYFCIFKQQPKHQKLRYREDHEPYQKLNEIDFVVDVSVQLFVGIPINILRVMQVKVDSTLQYDNIVLGRKQSY